MARIAERSGERRGVAKAGAGGEEAGELRDERGLHWFVVHDVVIDHYGPVIGVYGVAVYAAICRFAGHGADAWPGVRTIARLLGIDVRTVQRTIDRLIEAGLITVEARFGPRGEQLTNVYTLRQPGQRSRRSAQKQIPPPGTSVPGGGVHGCRGGGYMAATPFLIGNRDNEREGDTTALASKLRNAVETLRAGGALPEASRLTADELAALASNPAWRRLVRDYERLAG